MREPLVKQPYNGCPGCLFLLGLVVALFLVHGLFIYAQAFINEAKWNERGSPNYTITASEISLLRLGGKIQVRNGTVVEVQPSVYRDNQYYQWMTVSGLFERIRGYAFVPFSWETVDYDPNYGYPKTVRYNQWSLATDPPYGIDVYDLTFDHSP